MIKKYTNYLAISWTILIIFIVFIPGNQLPNHSKWFEVFQVDKIIHVFLFAPFAFLWLLNYYLRNMLDIQLKWIIFLIGVSLAIATELIQFYFIKGRSGNMADGIADIFGIVVGTLFFIILNSACKKSLQN